MLKLEATPLEADIAEARAETLSKQTSHTIKPCCQGRYHRIGAKKGGEIIV